MPRDILLFATDLDGTLIGHANEFPLYAKFREEIDAIRERMGTVWVACTGRDKVAYQHFISPMRAMGIVPDYVVLKHALIYSVRGGFLMPHILWNFHIRREIWKDKRQVRRAIDRWHRMITGSSSGVKTISKNGQRLRMRFDSAESAGVAANVLRQEVRPFHHLNVFEYRMEVDIRPVPYTKGLALAELARRLAIPPANVLAIGDGHNDLSMLTRGIAGMTGCPANAVPEVMQAVCESGGHMADNRSLAGVMEILHAHLTDQIKSKLPDGWRPPAEGENPMPSHHHHHHPVRRQTVVNFGLGLAIACVVLLIFASFGLIPFSDFFMRPFVLVERTLKSMFTWFNSR